MFKSESKHILLSSLIVSENLIEDVSVNMSLCDMSSLFRTQSGRTLWNECWHDVLISQHNHMTLDYLDMTTVWRL